LNEEQLLSDYRQVKPYLDEWGKLVDQTIISLLEPLIKDHRLKIFPSFRSKDESSFIAKAFYRKKPYTHPLLQIEDKIGTRVVMLTSDDVSEVAELLMSYKGWHAKKDRDPSETIKNTPEVFDYQSIHLVVKPLEKGSIFDENVVNLLTCEIQIRTLLQHAYAEISHDSTYKGPYKGDREIQRKLAKSMALMEATDDYFCNIFKLMNDVERKEGLYLNELSNRFLGVRPDFSKEQTDITLASLVFELLTKHDVPLQVLDRFIAKKGDELTVCIQANQSMLFKQPVILLIAYFLYNHIHFLKSNWPLNHEALTGVMNGFGYSAEMA
jgi:putative GTP pyrophosphokinase